MDSLALWPDFARNLEAATDIKLDYRTEGRLFVVLDHENAEGLRAKYKFNRSLGLPLEWLSGDEARKLEPNLSPVVTNAVFSPTAHWVDNRQVVLALKKAFTQSGGILRENTEAFGVAIENNRVRGVRLADEVLTAETVVLAAGAWSRITSLPESVRPPVRPVKGQMIAVQMPLNEPLVSRMVTGPIYLIPRSDGRLLIGATVENKGFDTRVTAGAVFDILDKARQMTSEIDNLPIIETWAGLRPASTDEAPILGPTSIDGLIVATGHYRHGILLAPITAQVISRHILTGQMPDIVTPFSPLRFSS
jgi:glycine oxidase